MKVNNLNRNQLAIIADAHALQVVELTSGSNGYPQNLRYALTGFDTYEEAEKFAEATGGEVTSIKQRDGWRFYESEGWTPRAYNLLDILSEANEKVYLNNDADFYLDSVKADLAAAIEGADNILDIKDYIEKTLTEAEEIYETINRMEDDEMLVMNDNGFGPRVIKTACANYKHDVWSYKIAVEFGTIDDIADMEDLADYINSCDDYPDRDIAEICESCGWTLGDDDVVCYDDDSQVVLGENGAKVINR